MVGNNTRFLTTLLNFNSIKVFLTFGVLYGQNNQLVRSIMPEDKDELEAVIKSIHSSATIAKWANPPEDELELRKYHAKEVMDKYWKEGGAYGEGASRLDSIMPVMIGLKIEVEDFIEGKSNGVSPVIMARAQDMIIGIEQQGLTLDIVLSNSANQFDEETKHRLRLRQEQAQDAVDILTDLTGLIVVHRLEERHIERDGLTQERPQAQTKVPKRQSPTH